MSFPKHHIVSNPTLRFFTHVITASVLAWGTYVSLVEKSVSFLDGVNLIFHEAGHALFFWAPTFLVVLGGTLVQVGVPLVCAYSFYRSRAFLSMMCALWWVGQTLVQVSVYVSDARAQVLPLLGGDAVNHDWTYLLTETGTIAYDTTIGQFVFILAGATMLYTVVHILSHTVTTWQHRYRV